MENVPPTAPTLRANWLSITGSVRDHNEDAIGIYESSPASFFVLCDGVGGAEAGEFVSEFAVKRMLKAFHEAPKLPSTNWSAVMEAALRDVNSEVRRVADEATARSGKPVMMGSTMVAVVIHGWNAFVAHVGDSRLYHWRAGGIVQATEDHSTVSTMMIPAVNPDGSIKKNVLMRGIGKGATIEPDLLLLNLQPGDKLLMCSDGMSDKITADEIATAFNTMPLTSIPEYLARTADTRMSKDNISVITIEIDSVAKPKEYQVPEQERAFYGYNSRWATTNFQAAGVNVGSGGAGSKRGWLLLLLAIIAVIVVGAVVVVASGGGGAVASPATATVEPKGEVMQTEEVAPTATPAPTDTPTPTETPVPTDTPTPTETPVPPTATLRS